MRHCSLPATYRRNNRRDRGRLVPQLLGWGPTMYWYPQLLGRSFQKSRNFTASVTRMQDLESEFSKIFREWHPRPSQWEGATPFYTQHPARPLTGCGAQASRCWDPNLGPLQLFSRGCAPGRQLHVSKSRPEKIQLSSKNEDGGIVHTETPSTECSYEWMQVSLRADKLSRAATLQVMELARFSQRDAEEDTHVDANEYCLNIAKINVHTYRKSFSPAFTINVSHVIKFPDKYC